MTKKSDKSADEFGEEFWAVFGAFGDDFDTGERMDGSVPGERVAGGETAKANEVAVAGEKHGDAVLD